MECTTIPKNQALTRNSLGTWQASSAASTRSWRAASPTPALSQGR